MRGVLVYKLLALFWLVNWLCTSELMDLLLCEFVCQLLEYPNKNEVVKSFVRLESIDP